jgi:hypothetical protein
LLTVLPGSNGTVTIDPLKNVYTNGEIVTLTAVPAPGYFLAGWGGDSSGDLNPLTLVLDANKLVTASFASESNRPPTFQSVVRVGDTLTFAWSTVPARTYQVEYKTNLTDTTWTSLGGPITATNSTTTTSDSFTAGPEQRWYRVGMLP